MQSSTSHSDRLSTLLLQPLTHISTHSRTELFHQESTRRRTTLHRAGDWAGPKPMVLHQAYLAANPDLAMSETVPLFTSSNEES